MNTKIDPYIHAYKLKHTPISKPVLNEYLWAWISFLCLDTAAVTWLWMYTNVHS